MFFQSTLWIVFAISLLFALAYSHYWVSLNCYFAEKTHSNLASIIQIPYILGMILPSVLVWIFRFDTYFNLLIIIIVFFIQLLSVLFVVFDKDIKTLSINKQSVKSFILPKSFRNVLFHSSLGIFQCLAFEVLPLYIVIVSAEISAIYIIIGLEVLKIISHLLGSWMYIKNKYNLAMVISSLSFTVAFAVLLFVTSNIIVYMSYAFLVIIFPLNFVPKFSTFIENVKAQSVEYINNIKVKNGNGKNLNISYYFIKERNIKEINTQSSLQSLQFETFHKYQNINISMVQPKLKCMPQKFTSVKNRTYVDNLKNEKEKNIAFQTLNSNIQTRKLDDDMNSIHIKNIVGANIVKREFNIIFAKVLVGIIFLITKSFILLAILGIVFSITMLLTSYRKKPKTIL